jgi:hypothetical protein
LLSFSLCSFCPTFDSTKLRTEPRFRQRYRRKQITIADASLSFLAHLLIDHALMICKACAHPRRRDLFLNSIFDLQHNAQCRVGPFRPGSPINSRDTP